MTKKLFVAGLSHAIFLLTTIAGAENAPQTVFHTNLIERTVTNVIEITMPVNRFQTQFHTNFVEVSRPRVTEVYKTNFIVTDQVRTNLVKLNYTNLVLVDAFKTNFTIMPVTNWLKVDAIRTNFIHQTVTNFATVEAFRTNVVTVTKTNLSLETVYRTNEIVQLKTNTVPVAAYRTNIVAAYRTNVLDVVVTNWQIVKLKKTNYVTAAIEKPAPEQKNAAHTPATVEPVAGSAIADVAFTSAEDQFFISAAALRRAKSRDSSAVLLKIMPKPGSVPPAKVQQWRIEKDDKSILCFGQELSFMRDLPSGKYNVEVRLVLQGDSAPRLLRGLLSLQGSEATIVSRPLNKKIASAN